MTKKISLRLFFVSAFVFFAMALAAIPANSFAAENASRTFLAPRFSSPDSSSTYSEGQSVRINLALSQVGLKVWTDLSVLDYAMPKEFVLRDNGTGTYSLITPLISGETMRVGQNLALAFKIKDVDGQVYEYSSTYLVTVKPRSFRGNANLEAPVRLSAEIRDGEVMLWWTKVYNAERMIVRYKDHEGNWRSVSVPKTWSGRAISGLINGSEYTFYVSGQAASGTLGEAKLIRVKLPAKKIIVQDSSAPAPAVVKTISPRISEQAATIAPVKKQVAQAVPITPEDKSQATKEETNKTAQEASTDTGASAAVKSDSWNRLLLAISILVIAAGAAVTGYYGYEWWVNRRTDSLKKRDKLSNRW